MADTESIKKLLRSVLQSSKDGVALSSLQAEYRALCGEAIPVKKLGFSSLEDYLRSIPSVVRLDFRLGSLVCFAALCKETTHIAELVARQKSTKKAGGSQVVNCRMRFKPSNPFALNVKAKTSLRQPSNSMSWTTNRRPADRYGGFSASGDIREQNLQKCSFIPVQHRPPAAHQATKSNVVLNKENGVRVNKSIPDNQSQKTQRAEPPAQVNKGPIDFNLELEQSRLREVLSKYNNGLWMSKFEAVFNKMFNQQPHPQTLLELEKWTHICSLEKPSMSNRTDCLIFPSLPTKSSTIYRNINEPSTSPSSPVSTPLSSCPSTPEKPPANASAPVPKPRGIPRNHLAKPTFVFPSEDIDNLPSVAQPGPDILTLLKLSTETQSQGQTLNATFNRKPEPQLDKNGVSPVLEEDVKQKVKMLLYKYRSGVWVQALPKLFEETFKVPLPEHALEDLSHWFDICDIEYPSSDKTKAILYYSCRDKFDTTEEATRLHPSGLEVVGSLLPPRLTFPEEQYPSVLVTDAKSSNAVTVRYVGKDYSNAQEVMEEAMRGFYTESSSSLSKLTIGQLVAVKGEDDEDVVRAQVMEVLSPHKVKVYYLDYGCSAEVSTHSLKELHQIFVLLPFQAFNVKLAGLEHCSSHLTMLSCLEKEAVGKILLMEKLEPCQHNDVPLVVLYDTSQDEDININSSCLKALQDETMNNPLTINATYQDVCITNVCANGIIYCQLPSRGMVRLDKLLEESEAFFKTQVTPELVCRPFSGKVCLACYNGKWSRVEVISIYGNRVVEILLIDYGLTVTVEVTELREIPPLFLKDLTIIPPQAIRCSLEGVQVPEGGWSPEAVKWVKELVLGSEAAKMKILKLGEHKGNRLVYMQLSIGTDNLKFEDSINHQLAQSELWQKLVTKHISNSSTDKGLSALMKRLSLTNLAPFANISQTGSQVITSKTDAESPSMPPLLDLPQPGQNMDVFVPVACHPGYFVLQPWQNLHKLVILMGEMVLYYNRMSKTEQQTEIKKGELYAAKVDKNWHRVLVKAILFNGLISVYELDHGKHELLKSTAIQPLIEEFRQLPFQAVTAQLAGLPQLQWSEEASLLFKNHVEKRALVAHVHSVKEAPDVRRAPWERKLTVYLVDTTMENRDLWIHTVMGNLDVELSSAA